MHRFKTILSLLPTELSVSLQKTEDRIPESAGSVAVCVLFENQFASGFNITVNIADITTTGMLMLGQMCVCEVSFYCMQLVKTTLECQTSKHLCEGEDLCTTPMKRFRSTGTSKCYESLKSTSFFPSKNCNPQENSKLYHINNNKKSDYFHPSAPKLPPPIQQPQGNPIGMGPVNEL